MIKPIRTCVPGSFFLFCLPHSLGCALPQILEDRGAKENLRFDHKLKGKGLLDLSMPKPNTAVPKNTAKPKK